MKKKKKNLQTYIRKPTILWIVLFIISYLALIFLDFYSPIKISKETLNWTFSTVAQAFVALLALLGMVSIYKLQIIQNRIRDLSKEIKEEEERGFPPPIDLNRPFINVVFLKAQLENEQESKQILRNQTLFFFKYTFLLIFLSLIFLILSPIVSSIQLVSLFSLIVILIMSLRSMMHAVKLIKWIL